MSYTASPGALSAARFLDLADAFIVLSFSRMHPSRILIISEGNCPPPPSRVQVASQLTPQLGGQLGGCQHEREKRVVVPSRCLQVVEGGIHYAIDIRSRQL